MEKELNPMKTSPDSVNPPACAETPLDKLTAAIKASWQKNGGNPASYEARRLHEQGFLDGMQYALKKKIRV